MGKVLLFNRKRKKETQIEHKREVDYDMNHFSDFFDLTFSLEQIHILSKIFENQSKIHTERMDYSFMILKSFEEFLNATKEHTFRVHAIELYYFKMTIKDELARALDNYTGDEQKIIRDLLKIVLYHAKSHAPAIRQFASLNPMEKIMVIEKIWSIGISK